MKAMTLCLCETEYERLRTLAYVRSRNDRRDPNM